MQACLRYGVRTIFGIQCGYEGLIKEYGHSVLNLTPESVQNIHSLGGSVLGTSRGPQDASQIVERLCELNVNVLFIVGGDGTLRGANQIASEAERLNCPISIVDIPKTIDNDIMFTDKSFGYETACAAAVEAIKAAHAEARSVRNGVGLVKLMGRHSGFIACAAAIAMSEVDFVLIPEVSFALEGDNGFLKALEQRIQQSAYALIVVAEGAGQELFNESNRDTDLSGNFTLKDIGLLLKNHIENHSKRRSLNVKFKYIDPSYMIRGLRANPQDASYCVCLAQNAVHARNGWKDWHSNYMLAWTLCTCLYQPCGRDAQANRSQKRSLAFCNRIHRSVAKVL